MLAVRQIDRLEGRQVGKYVVAPFVDHAELIIDIGGDHALADISRNVHFSALLLVLILEKRSQLINSLDGPDDMFLERPRKIGIFLDDHANLELAFRCDLDQHDAPGQRYYGESESDDQRPHRIAFTPAASDWVGSRCTRRYWRSRVHVMCPAMCASNVVAYGCGMTCWLRIYIGSLAGYQSESRQEHRPRDNNLHVRRKVT